MDQNERFHWNVVIKMAQAGNEEMLENLESENRWRKENNLPSVEEELGLVAVTAKKETAKEDFVPKHKEPMVLVSLKQPRAKLWAVMPKTEWEQKTWTAEDILGLVEKQVRGQTLREAIAEAEELSKQPWEPLSKLLDALSKDWRELGNEIAAYPNVLPPTHLLCRWEEKIFNIMGELHKELKEIWNAPLAKESLQEQLQRLVEALENAELAVEPATGEEEPMTEEQLYKARISLLHPRRKPLWKDLAFTPEQLKELRRIKNEIDECIRERGISPENAT